MLWSFDSSPKPSWTRARQVADGPASSPPLCPGLPQGSVLVSPEGGGTWHPSLQPAPALHQPLPNLSLSLWPISRQSAKPVVSCWGPGPAPPRPWLTLPLLASLSPRAPDLWWVRTGWREGWAAEGQTEPRPGRPALPAAQHRHRAQPRSSPSPAQQVRPRARSRASALMSSGFRDCPQGHGGEGLSHYCLKPPRSPLSLPLPRLSPDLGG